MSITLRRIGGCNIPQGIIGILFDGDIIPIRLRASCKTMLSKVCNITDCPRYHIGTIGSHKISWDKKNRRI